MADLSSAHMDIGYQSIFAINSRLSLFFGKQDFVLADPYLSDYKIKIFKNPPGRSLNVVLSGGFLSRFFEMADWPEGKYKIWVLCSRAKALLEDVFDLPQNLLGVIPRYVLFPRAEKLQQLDFNRPLSIIYGGRFVRAKGIFNVLSFAQVLQREFALPVKLYLYGRPREALPINYKFSQMSNAQLKKHINQIVSSEWSYARPKLFTKKTSIDWVRSANELENPIFISFSQLSHEDFGVSLAQAQSLGWPSILSSWGAHFDANLQNTSLLPQFKILQHAKATRTIMKNVAKDFLTQKLESVASPKNKHTKAREINSRELLKYYGQSEKKYLGIKSHSLNGFRTFIKYSSGVKLFNRYNNVFAGVESK